MSAGFTLASSFISVRKFPPGPKKKREIKRGGKKGRNEGRKREEIKRERTWWFFE